MLLVIVHTPGPHKRVWITPICMSMLVLASLVLVFVTLDALSEFVVAWLHLTPVRPCLDVTT